MLADEQQRTVDCMQHLAAAAEVLEYTLALLEQGCQPVHEVARHVGYRNKSHFARAFRAAHGCLPSDVRAN